MLSNFVVGQKMGLKEDYIYCFQFKYFGVAKMGTYISAVYFNQETIFYYQIICLALSRIIGAVNIQNTQSIMIFVAIKIISNILEIFRIIKRLDILKWFDYLLVYLVIYSVGNRFVVVADIFFVFFFNKTKKYLSWT